MNDRGNTAATFTWDVPDTFNFGTDVVDRWAESQPDADAIIWVDGDGGERRVSYRDARNMTDAIAGQLTALGVTKGDTVIVMLPRVPEWHLSMVAVLKLGAVPLPCITMLTSEDLGYRISHAGVRAVITTAAEAPKFDGFSELIRLCVGERAGWVTLDPTFPGSATAAVVRADDPAVLYYTSGSTGSPKGVLHAARALFAWRCSAEHWLALRAGDIMWCTADTGWSKAGTSILFGPWSRGATVLLYDGPFEPRRRFELLDRYRVTCYCAAATELRQLIALDDITADLSALRLTVSAGESVNPEVVMRWQQITGHPVLDGYGQTETLMTVTNRPGHLVKPGSMGLPLPGLDVALWRADGTVAAQGSGELLIGLPNPGQMLGYLADASRTAEHTVEADGRSWWRTGDNVEIDDDGYVFYVGRADDIINSSGYRIGPQEVENALLVHPAVQESAAVGTPDRLRGEVVTVFVVLTPAGRAAWGADQAGLVSELQSHVKRVTAPYKYPRIVHFVDVLPKTVSGKLQRNELRRIAAASHQPTSHQPTTHQETP